MLCTKPLAVYGCAVILCASLHNVTRITKVCGLYGSPALPLQAICVNLQHSKPNAVQRGYCGVQGKVACCIANIDDMLQPIDPLLAALRYLSLLYDGPGQDAKDLLQ